MKMRWLAVLLSGFELCGCSSSRQVWVAQSHHSIVGWDGLGRNPDLPAIKRARSQPEKPQLASESTETASAIEKKEAELAGLRPYSHEWVTLRRDIDAAEDARIAKILMICKGCEIQINQAKIDPQVTASSKNP
jgi:hypothetical protein